ncbi:hypothetical protein ACT1U9_04820 [Streptomyces sp. BR1]|uniref:hypothetical protein n=1 Tax=Streptomyces sp. BR1 TaxID=1592323 RepID=UPI00402B561B
MSMFGPLSAQEHRTTPNAQAARLPLLPEEEPLELVIEVLSAPSGRPALFSLCWAGDLTS